MSVQAKHIPCCLSFIQSFVRSFVRSFNRYLSNAKYVPNAVLAAEGRAARKISAVRVRSLSASTRYAHLSVHLHPCVPSVCTGLYLCISVYAT